MYTKNFGVEFLSVGNRLSAYSVTMHFNIPQTNMQMLEIWSHSNKYNSSMKIAGFYDCFSKNYS